MKPKRNSPQLAFPWFSDRVLGLMPRRKKSVIPKLRWPPQIGRKIAFRTDFGIEMGVLRMIRQGLVWKEYLMKDGKIASEGEIVMRPDNTEWRHPSLVTESEVTLTVLRLKTAYDADPSRNLRKLPLLWSDFCQLQTYLVLRSRWERDCKESAFGLATAPRLSN